MRSGSRGPAAGVRPAAGPKVSTTDVDQVWSWPPSYE